MRRAILLVEDDRMIAAMLSRAIESWGYVALHAPGCREALKITTTCEHEIILTICDIVLSDGTGSGVAAAIRRICPRALILFTSGYSLDILHERGLLTTEILHECGAGYLQKPFAPRELRSIVDSCVETLDASTFISAG